MSKVSTAGLNVLQHAQQRAVRLDALKKSDPAQYDPDSPEYKKRVDPTNGMNTGQKFLAGTGKAFVDVGRGIQQLNPFADDNQAEIDDAKRLDAPLMRTKAGIAGNIIGNVAIAAPTAFIPGANTMTGAALIGAGMGGMQPVATGESRLQNMAVGGVAGPLGILAGRGIAAGYQGTKALVEPFTAAGRDRIAARALQQFGVGASDVAGLSGAPTATGARTTLAEQVSSPEAAAGAARLQDSLRTMDPQFAGQLVSREAENNAARVGVLRDLAGEGGARDAAAVARNEAAEQLYGDAFRNTTALTPSQLKAQADLLRSGRIEKLMQSPAVQDAMTAARTNAENSGKSFSADGSIEGLHDMKLAIDGMMKDPSNAAQAAKLASLGHARDRLVDVIETLSPGYEQARNAYASMSRPVNQMDVAADLFRRGTSATGDLAGTPRLMPEKYGSLLKNDEATVKAATGRRDLGTLSQVLEPDQFAKVVAVGKELDKAAAVGRAANGPGSATAARLASQNVLRQTLGPTGLPQSWAESTMLNTLARPLQFAYNGVAEPKIQAVLADLVLNPSKAAAVMQAAAPAQRKVLGRVLADPRLAQAVKTSLPAAAVSERR